MSNQDRLLSDEELKQECLTIIALQEYGTTPSNLSGEQIAKIGFASVDLYQFINTQKRLYEESATKKLHIDNWTDVGSKVAFKNETMTYSKASMFRKGWNAALDELRAEQRARIK